MTTQRAVSWHGIQRMSQRNLSRDEVEFVCTRGMREHRAGVAVYFLGRRDYRTSEEARQYGHLEGTTVVCCPHCGFVVTVYRNRERGLKDHCHKPKYSRTKQRCFTCGR